LLMGFFDPCQLTFSTQCEYFMQQNSIIFEENEMQNTS